MDDGDPRYTTPQDLCVRSPTLLVFFFSLPAGLSVFHNKLMDEFNIGTRPSLYTVVVPPT
jgi:hypothetical protein